MAADGLGGRRVAVVGAGLAGLAAALELRRHGLEVEIFERTRLIGGKATSFVAGGHEVDSGQHVFLGCFQEWLAMVRELGMEDRLYLQPRFEVVVLAGGGARAHLRAARLPAPWHLLPALFGHRLLGWRARLALGRALLGAARSAGRDHAFDRESFADWLLRHGQGERSRLAFWEPFFVPALNAPLDEVAAAAGRFVITTAFLGGPDACRIGWSRVPLARIGEAAAARASRLHLRTAVTGLDFEVEPGRGHAPRWVRGVRIGEDARHFDGVVLAVPPAAVARILGEPEVYGVRGLDRIREQPIVDVHLWYDRAPVLTLASRAEEGGGGFAALVGSPVQWVFEKEPGYLCCSLSAAEAQVTRPEAELVQLCHAELVAVLPRLRGECPARGLATRDPHATFVALPGLTRPPNTTTVPNLVLAGAWTDTGWPATMESAVRSGRAAGRVLAGHLAGGRVAA
jgi:squalene-associated FAD-dependent desaturase